MTALHGQGPPRSTVADAIAAIVYHYAATASRGAWAPSTSYVVDDSVSSDGRLYRCFTPGTSNTGSGPAGMGSQRDAGGVGWTPVLYIGERYLKQAGAPPRIVIIPGDGKIGDAAPGPKRIGDGNTTVYAADFIAYLWAAEASDDLARYGAIESAIDRFANVMKKIAPGHHTLATVSPIITANVVTFGEDRQIRVTYTRGVPRDAAIWDVPVAPQPTLDPARPNGDTGTTFVVDPTTAGSH